MNRGTEYSTVDVAVVEVESEIVGQKYLGEDKRERTEPREKIEKKTEIRRETFTGINLKGRDRKKEKATERESERVRLRVKG